jgi:predicted Zn-dependent protease
VSAETIIGKDWIFMFQTDEMYLKASLHEAGHVLGLEDNNSQLGTTVMNAPSGLINDRDQNQPMTVTACDAKRAREVVAPLGK